MAVHGNPACQRLTFAKDETLSQITFYDKYPEPVESAAELLDGLAGERKSIPPKFFYDERGSELFTEITRQPEYYPTRTEMKLLADKSARLQSLIGDDSVVIEYGSGSSEKIRLLLESLQPKIYAPLDISRDYLARSAEEVAAEFPWLEVHAACIDYTKDFALPFDFDERKVGFFPGSSIGNFAPADARIFLSRVRQQLGDDGALLIGVDMKKDRAMLERAYNDAAGMTAAFNLNVLNHLNRDFDADFDTDRFDHLAEYNADEGCIQMFLVSCEAQCVTLGETTVNLDAGERIHTENSHKYSADEFLEMAASAGFEDNECWQDENGWFSLFYLHGKAA